MWLWDSIPGELALDLQLTELTVSPLCMIVLMINIVINMILYCIILILLLVIIFVLLVHLKKAS